ncbi:MAG: hypothetical protein HQK72_14945 [Desulfamplus sp.]|nr:hypothetical protein [Desulfamplus sp.]
MKQNKYSLLRDDLTHYMRGYSNNQLITVNQRNEWKRITQASLGQQNNRKSSFKPLVLLEIDNSYYDNQPVGSVSSTSAERFFNYDENHVFPPMRDLVRFGCFFHLDLYHMLPLVLKNEWERYFGHDVQGWRNFTGVTLFDVLKTANEIDMREQNARAFKPDSQFIFDLFEIHGQIVTKAGYTIETFSALINEMILQRLHWEANTSDLINRFAQEEINRLELIKTGSVDEQEALWKARLEFDEQHNQVDNLVWRLQNLELKKEKINFNWNRIFGELELQLKAQILRIETLERYILLKTINPDLTEDGVLNAIKEENEEINKKLERSNYENLIVDIYNDFPQLSGTPVSDEFIYEYKKKCIALLRQIRKLTHDDRLRRNPAYSQLTENQKNELKQILMLSLKVQPDELIYPSNVIGHDMRTIEGLHRVLDRINTILQNSGIDIDPDYYPQGETIQEQLRWYLDEIKILQKEKELYTERLASYVKDIETKRKNILLEVPEEHLKIKNGLKKQVESFITKAEELERNLAVLFGVSDLNLNFKGIVNFESDLGDGSYNQNEFYTEE